MRRIHWLMLALALLVIRPRASSAEATCPWMNMATAAGFLGGEVESTVTGVTPDGDATCEFTRIAQSSTRPTLRIAVRTMANADKDFPAYLALCNAAPVALRGIGNEAVHCIPSSGGSKCDELIVGRVRKRAFVITIQADWIAKPPTSPTKTRNPISDHSENIAEQVAGSLF